MIQRFPYTIKHKTEPMVLVARLKGANITLDSHGTEVGYLTIKRYGSVWGLKDIVIHNPGMRGKNLGALLVYLFARLASNGHATQLQVFTPSGSGLYRHTGFVITPNNLPNHPPSITGSPATVRDTARDVVSRDYRIYAGLLEPLRVRLPNPPLINNNRDEGNPAIRNRDL